MSRPHLHSSLQSWNYVTAFSVACLLTSVALGSPDPIWQNLSSRRGEIPLPPGQSTQQTGAVVADFDGDGVKDFILSFRQKPPALAWYRHTNSGWEQSVIERDYLTVEAGGAVWDIDGDGDLDVVFGGDWQSNEVWWWENPAPNFDPNTNWKRHLIKKGGKSQHHDQVFGDFLGKGQPQLAFWNQQAKTLYLAEIPENPRSAESWPLTEIISGTTSGSTPYTEGMSAFDVDGDGKVDLLAYNTWYKHNGEKNFKPIKLADEGGLIFAGYFKPSKVAQIVISPGDGSGPVRWFECTGDPEDSKAWVSRELLDRPVIHGHSLQLGDIDRDGNLDIFLGEMAKWSENKPMRDNPEAVGWTFYGDGQGHFTRKEVVVGHGWHEARLQDLDGDGDLDLLNKPYNWDTPRVDLWLNNGTRPSAKGVGTSRSFSGPVGLELYSLRDIMAQNVGLGLQYARNFGFREIEVGNMYGMSATQFKAALTRFELKPVAAIYDFDRYAKEIEGIISDAKALGLSYVGTAGIPHSGAFKEDDARKAAAAFNSFSEKLAAQGLKFFYHNHGFEFVPFGDGTLFDLLVTETKPEWVTFEMDIFWTVHPAQDPVKLLRKYPNRWSLMHVKDMRKGTKTGLLTGSEDVRNDVALGSGQIDIPATLRTAQAIGIKYFFIEDESPTVIQQLPQSLKYLESLAW